MNIIKIELLTTVKGAKRMIWGKGTVLSAPFPTDIEGLLFNTSVVKVLSYKPIEAEKKVEEKPKEPEKPIDEVKNDKAEGPKPKRILIKKKNT